MVLQVFRDLCLVTLYFKVQVSLLTDFCLNKLVICCLSIVRKAVVKFRYGVGLMDLEYGHAALNVLYKYF